MNKESHHRRTERFRNGKEAFDQRDHEGLHAGGQDLQDRSASQVRAGESWPGTHIYALEDRGLRSHFILRGATTWKMLQDEISKSGFYP